MYKVRVTIYSPEDKEEHVYEAPSDKIDGIVFMLSSQWEIGAWFKLERIS